MQKLFRRQGNKIIIFSAPEVKQRKGRIVEKCDKTGSVWRPEGSNVWYDTNTGKVTMIQSSTHPTELDAMQHFDAQKKAGIQDIVDLNRALWQAGRGLGSTKIWEQKGAMEQLQLATKLVRAVQAKPRLRFLLKGISITEKTTPEQLLAMQKKLQLRIVHK